MKNNANKGNARLSADRVFRPAAAFLVLTALIVVFASRSVRFREEAKSGEIRAKKGIFRLMETNMAKCAQIGVKMQYAGADLKDDLLPRLDTYLYALEGLTQAFYESFGEETSVLPKQFLSKVVSAKGRLERDLSQGDYIEDSKKALVLCLDEFSEILNRWDTE